MNVTKELLEKAKTARSIEELQEMAKAENITLTEEEAATYFAGLHTEGEISDEELDNVSGGCGGESRKKCLFEDGAMVKYQKLVRWEQITCAESIPIYEWVTSTVVSSYKSGSLFWCILANGDKILDCELKPA